MKKAPWCLLSRGDLNINKEVKNEKEMKADSRLDITQV